MKWFGIGESIGVYPSGVNTDGSKAGYPGNIDAGSLIQVGIHHEISKNTTLHAWNLVVPKVFNAKRVGEISIFYFHAEREK